MVKQVRRYALAGLLGIGLMVMSAPKAQAVEIVGLYNFTLGSVQVTFGRVDWNPPLNYPVCAFPGCGFQATPTYGSFDINSVSARTGVFADADFQADGLGPLGLPPLRPESIQDMTDPILVGDANSVPVGVNPTPIDGFFQLAERPTWHFVETFLTPGTAGLPFLIAQQGPNVSTTMTINGYAYDSATPTQLTAWTAVISAQYTNMTEAELEAAVLAGTLRNNSWSGTFEATNIPEPATLLTFGFGAVAAVRRRRNAKK